MDNNYIGNLEIKKPEYTINTNPQEKEEEIFNNPANINAREKMDDDVPQLNINEEYDKNIKYFDKLKHDFMWGLSNDSSVIEVKREDYRLQNAVDSYLQPLISDNFRIKGRTNVDKITDAPPRPSFFSFRSIKEKRQEERHVNILKAEYKEQYGKDAKCPKFNNTSYKIRKSAKIYAENKPERESKLPQNKEKILKDGLSFHFTSGICNEAYMTSHYTYLKTNIDNCMFLPELLKRDTHFWNNLSPGLKEMVELQAESAKCFSELFYYFGRKHFVDTENGDFIPKGLNVESYYTDARKKYQIKLRENYKIVSQIKEKSHLKASKDIEKLLKKIGNETS